MLSTVLVSGVPQGDKRWSISRKTTACPPKSWRSSMPGFSKCWPRLPTKRRWNSISPPGTQTDNLLSKLSKRIAASRQQAVGLGFLAQAPHQHPGGNLRLRPHLDPPGLQRPVLPLLPRDPGRPAELLRHAALQRRRRRAHRPRNARRSRLRTDVALLDERRGSDPNRPPARPAFVKQCFRGIVAVPPHRHCLTAAVGAFRLPVPTAAAVKQWHASPRSLRSGR